MKYFATSTALLSSLLLAGCMSIAANAFNQATAYRYHPLPGVAPAQITRTVEASSSDMEAPAPMRRLSVFVQEVDGNLVTSADRHLQLAPGPHVLQLHATLFDESVSANQFDMVLDAAAGQHYQLDLQHDDEDDFVVALLDKTGKQVQAHGLGL